MRGVRGDLLGEQLWHAVPKQFCPRQAQEAVDQRREASLIDTAVQRGAKKDTDNQHRCNHGTDLQAGKA